MVETAVAIIAACLPGESYTLVVIRITLIIISSSLSYYGHCLASRNEF
jgi:hypothetical protein